MKPEKGDLTVNVILGTNSDDELQELLSAELTSRLGSNDLDELNGFVQKLRALPIGLRAMAATYQLDVSMALDDLGWHFANWHDKAYAQETLAGLYELGAVEEAQIFQEAFAIAQENWDFFGSAKFRETYMDSEVEKALKRLNDRLWRLLGHRGDKGTSLVERWAAYARRYPGRVCAEH